MLPSDDNAPTQVIEPLAREVDAENQLMSATPSAPSVEPTTVRSRVTVALALTAVLLVGVLGVVLVIPVGVGRTSNAVASPTLTVPDPTTSTTPPSTSSIGLPPPSIDPTTSQVPEPIVIVTEPTTALPQPTTTASAPSTSTSTTSPSTSTTTSTSTTSTTSTTTAKTPPQTVTFTATKTVPCLLEVGTGQAQLTFATKNATTVELVSDGGTPKPLGSASGTAKVTYSCSKATHTYALLAHGPGGDATQALTVTSG